MDRIPWKSLDVQLSSFSVISWGSRHPFFLAEIWVLKHILSLSHLWFCDYRQLRYASSPTHCWETFSWFKPVGNYGEMRPLGSWQREQKDVRFWRQEEDDKGTWQLMKRAVKSDCRFGDDGDAMERTPWSHNGQLSIVGGKNKFYVIWMRKQLSKRW